MLSIKWNNEKMSVGIDLIDNQHKTLIDLINNIMLSIQDQRQIENIDNFIEDAVSYTQYHFATEENLFHELDLPKDDIKRHKKELIFLSRLKYKNLALKFLYFLKK